MLIVWTLNRFGFVNFIKGDIDLSLFLLIIEGKIHFSNVYVNYKYAHTQVLVTR